jgi:hypothetical protein
MEFYQLKNHWQVSIPIPSSAWSSRVNRDIVARYEDAAIARLNESNKLAPLQADRWSALAVTPAEPTPKAAPEIALTHLLSLNRLCLLSAKIKRRTPSYLAEGLLVHHPSIVCPSSAIASAVYY